VSGVHCEADIKTALVSHIANYWDGFSVDFEVDSHSEWTKMLEHIKTHPGRHDEQRKALPCDSYLELLTCEAMAVTRLEENLGPIRVSDLFGLHISMVSWSKAAYKQHSEAPEPATLYLHFDFKETV
jgi:hypothetical protein